MQPPPASLHQTLYAAAAKASASAICTKVDACSVTVKVVMCRNMPLNTARGSRQMLVDDETRDNSFDMEVDWIRVSYRSLSNSVGFGKSGGLA